MTVRPTRSAPANPARSPGGPAPRDLLNRGRSVMLLVLLAVLLAATLLAIIIGSVAVPLEAVFALLGERLFRLAPLAAWPDKYRTILFDIRLPRIAFIAVTGAALALAGAAYQGLFRNPLADPYLVGVASGAGLGATIALTLQLPGTFWA